MQSRHIRMFFVVVVQLNSVALNTAYVHCLVLSLSTIYFFFSKLITVVISA